MAAVGQFPFGSTWERGRIEHVGNVFFVNSTATMGSDATSSGNAKAPYRTMHYANQRCTANNGDVVIVHPNHVETVGSNGGLTLDKAGVYWYCPMSGSKMAQINFTTGVGADMDITGANIKMENFLFTGGVDALTGPISINAADVQLLNIETRDVTGQAVDFIVTTANCNRLLISNWTHRGASAAGADTAISIVGGDGITIEGFWIDGNFAVAAIENVTTAATNLTISGPSRLANGRKVSYARTRNAADVIFTAVAATTGNVGPGIYARLQDNAANITEAFVGAAMQFFQDIAIVNADGEASMLTNITASTDA